VYLGLDVGGTKCRWQWLPSNRPGGSAPGVQPAVHGEAAAIAALAAALRTALGDGGPPAACVIGMAGAGDRALAGRIEDGLRRQGITCPLAVVGDVLAAVAGSLADGSGVLVQAGTGSFAVARAASGELHRAGGRGYLLGDQGSAYDLVRRAAAAVVLAADGLGPATALTDALVRAFGAPSALRLGACLQQLDTGAVAAHVQRVLEAAAAGDEVSTAVLDEGMEALAMVANAAVRAAGLEWHGIAVTFGGGLLLGAPAVADLLSKRLRSLGAGPARLAAEDAAVCGAAALALALAERREPLASWVAHGAV
jgi:glucosamine kinase